MAPAGGWVGSLWPMTTRGCFVVLDGPDGGGKTTQALRLVRRLQAAGRDVLHVRDPGSNVVGERIRDVLLEPALGEVVPMCEMLLYQAARAQLARGTIGPALDAGRDVVCERWHYATTAYQAFGGGVPREAVVLTSELATGGVEPHAALLLDVAADVAAQRMDRPKDRIEARARSYRDRVAEGFREVFAEDPSRRHVIDASASPDEVEAAIWRHVEPLLSGEPRP